MLRRMLLFAILLSVSSVNAMDKFEALSQIESGDCDYCVGRAGEISRYQIKRSVWRSNTSLPFSTATSQIEAKAVALCVQGRRIAHFEAIQRRSPTDVEFYLLWNRPNRVDHPRRRELERARRFANLCRL